MNVWKKFGSLLLGLTLTFQATWAAEPIVICFDDKPHPPMLFPDHDGSMQTIVKLAAARSGITPTLTPLPLKRCRDSVDANLVSAMLGVSYTPLNQAAAVFPMKESHVDASRALGSVRAMVFRARGSRTGWNGVAFTGLKLPVLLQSYPTFLAKLDALGVSYDDRASTVENNFSKLLFDRGAVVIAFENDGIEALSHGEFANKIEMLPIPFTETAYYLVFSREFFKQTPQLAENFWNAIREVKKSPAYKAPINPENR